MVCRGGALHRDDVLIDEDALQAARDRPAYRAGIWAFRVALIVLAAQIVLTLLGVVHSYYGPIGIWFVLGYVAAVISGYTLLAKAGVQVFGIAEGIGHRRKTVYRDVVGLGRWNP
jgi:hypothetical protein